MDVNKAIRETREKILKVLNESGLPIEILRLLLVEFQTIVTNQASAEALAELPEAKKESSDGTD